MCSRSYLSVIRLGRLAKAKRIGNHFRRSHIAGVLASLSNNRLGSGTCFINSTCLTPNRGNPLAANYEIETRKFEEFGMLQTTAYKPKQFNLSELQGISNKTLEMHFKL